MSRGARRDRGPSKTAVVGYGFEGLSDADLSAVEKLMAGALVKKTITQYDTGSRGYVWWNGPPGPEMRVLRRHVAALPGAKVVRAVT